MLTKITPQTPGGGGLSVADLEQMLTNWGCKKTGPCSRFACRWETPDGRGFHAPNPNNVKFVPTSQKDFLWDTVLKPLQDEQHGDP